MTQGPLSLQRARAWRHADPRAPSATPRSPARTRGHAVGLLDHMGGGNLGDDTTQTAVIDGIRQRWPDAAIFGLSMNPADTQARHGITSYPIRRNLWVDPSRSADPGDGAAAAGKAASRANRLWHIPRMMPRICLAVLGEIAFLARSLHVMRRLDILVISGGGQLLDSWGGPWAYPYTIFKWTLLAKLARARCYFINVGAGPLRAPLSRAFVCSALRLAATYPCATMNPGRCCGGSASVAKPTSIRTASMA